MTSDFLFSIQFYYFILDNHNNSKNLIIFFMSTILFGWPIIIIIETYNWIEMKSTTLVVMNHI